MISKFYNTLFNEGEGICWSRDEFGTEVIPKEKYDTSNYARYFSVNPLLIGTDKLPSRPSHSRFVGRRADINVSAFRNILCEFDILSLEAQHRYIEESEVPYSTLVYSGGKSLHMIISLEWPCASRDEYRELVKRVYTKLKHVDHSTSNPSRLSRAPGATRDNGKQQTLIAVQGRVPNSELLNWLGPAPVKLPEQEYIAQGMRLLPIRTHTFLKYGAAPGERNRQLFSNSCEMFRAGFSYDEILTEVSKVLDLPEHEIRSCISSAERMVRATRSSKL